MDIKKIITDGITAGRLEIEARAEQARVNRERARQGHLQRCRELAERHLEDNLGLLVKDAIVDGKPTTDVFHSDDLDEAEAVCDLLKGFAVNVERDVEGYEDDEPTITYRVVLTLPTEV